MHARHSSFSDEFSFYLEDEGLNPGEFANLSKPNDSYCGLIRRALLQSPRQRLFLHEIYDYISSHYSYFRNSGNGWKNSVRHALSTGKEFIRIKESRKCATRGSEWCLRESAIGQWYMSLNEGKYSVTNEYELSNESMAQMIEFSYLIPELCDVLSSKAGALHNDPCKPVIDLENYPAHLLGIVPNPDFFACPQSSYPPIEMQDYPNYHASRLLHSPKSYPATPMRK